MTVTVKRALIFGAAGALLVAIFALTHNDRTFARARPVGLGVALDGHAGSVSGVVFSPNGNSLATATEHGTVQLWDLRRDGLAGTLRGLVGIVDSVAFSPHGRIVAAGSRNGVVRFWDAPSHRQLGVALKPRAGSVYSVAFSPNGRILAAARADGTVDLWDAHSHSLLGELNNRAGAIASLAFSPDGRTLAVGDIRATVVLWDVRSRHPLGVPVQTHHLVNSVAYSPNGQMLAVANGDGGTVGLWDVHSQHLTRTLRTGNRDPINSVVFRADRGRIAVLGLEPPDEAGGFVGQSVDRLQRRFEARHHRTTHRPPRKGDVELCEVVFDGRDPMRSG